jgi:hypothetical protein
MLAAKTLTEKEQHESYQFLQSSLRKTYSSFVDQEILHVL